MKRTIKFLPLMAMLLTLATTAFRQAADPDAGPPTTLKACLSRMEGLCARHSTGWSSVFDAVGTPIKTRCTERFAALELVGQDGLDLRYKLRGTRDASSLSDGKEFAWNDRGITVYQVSLKSLDENKISWSKKLQLLSDSPEASAKYAQVFVLTDDKTAKVRVSYEDAQDAYRINGVVQTGDDRGHYSQPPRDRPSLVLYLPTVDVAHEVADLLKAAIVLAKKQ